MRLSTRITKVGMAGLLVGAVFGAQSASAAQNYAPVCTANASITNAAEFKVAYGIVCTDSVFSETVETAGDNNEGDWTAKDYAEGSYVKYTDNKWYKAALDVTAADEPTKPSTDADSNVVTVWVELTTDTATTWTASATSSTTTAGSFKSGYVVSYTVSGTKKWFQANADTVAADVPGTSGKWTQLAGQYNGPQPGGSKKVAVTYPGQVSGYSVVSLNRQVLGFETEPVILTADGTGPAPLQTQYCNGDHPGFGVSCSLQSSVNLYAKAADESFLKVTGATLAVKSGSSYTDLKDTGLYADKTVAGPSLAIGSADFLSVGALGLPTNPGKKIFPAQSGSRITGELELLDDPCGWGDSSLRLVTVLADGEGQMAAPIEVSLENSKYFHTVKDADGAWQSEYIPTGCSFNNSYYRTQVYYRQGGVLKKVVKAGKKAVPTTFTATS